MDSITSSLIIIIPSAFLLVLGLWVSLRGPYNKINQVFFAIVVSAFSWNYAHFLFNLSPPVSEILNFWSNMSYLASSFTFTFFLYFSYIFPKADEKVSRRKTILIFLLPVITIPLALTQRITTFWEVDPGGGYSIGWGWGSYLYHFLIFIFIALIAFNFLYKLKNEKGRTNRRSLLIVSFALVSGLVIGTFFTVFLPIFFNRSDLIDLGPSLSSLVVVFMVAYAIVRYDLMEIKVIAKRALFYATVVASSTLLLSGTIFLSRFIEEDYPTLSLWLIPAIFSIIAVFLGVYIWKGMRASEDMKHEFVTVVTHKFRTPLSRVVWALDDLKRSDLKKEDKENIRSIETSTKNILELVDMLTTISDEKGTEHNLDQKINISELLKGILFDYKGVASQKNISIDINVDEDIFVLAEKSKVSFAIKSLIDNAIMYTPEGGKVSVTLSSSNKKAKLEVKDTGIGMDEKTKNFIFTTFFRGDEAKTMYTEGLGVGLYISKRIIDETGGDIGFYSEGEGEGSTFFMEFPVV